MPGSQPPGSLTVVATPHGEMLCAPTSQMTSSCSAGWLWATLSDTRRNYTARPAQGGASTSRGRGVDENTGSQLCCCNPDPQAPRSSSPRLLRLGSSLSVSLAHVAVHPRARERRCSSPRHKSLLGVRPEQLTRASYTCAVHRHRQGFRHICAQLWTAYLVFALKGHTFD